MLFEHRNSIATCKDERIIFIGMPFEATDRIVYFNTDAGISLNIFAFGNGKSQCTKKVVSVVLEFYFIMSFDPS